MRRIVAPIASLSLFLLAAGESQAATLPKIPSVLKGTASGETVVSSVPPATPQVGRTAWSVKNLKLELALYGFVGVSSRNWSATYRIASGTLSYNHDAAGGCDYSFSESGKMLPLLGGTQTTSTFVFSRSKGRSKLGTNIELAPRPGVKMTCDGFPGEPPVAITDIVALPALFELVPSTTSLKLSGLIGHSYSSQSTRKKESLKIDWNLQLKGSRFTNKVRD